jgi:hypothetical protein
MIESGVWGRSRSEIRIWRWGAWVLISPRDIEGRGPANCVCFGQSRGAPRVWVGTRAIVALNPRFCPVPSTCPYSAHSS